MHMSGVRFDSPAYLLLLPLALSAVWWTSAHSLASLSPARRCAAAVVRCALVAGLVLALAGPQGVRANQSMCTIFALDVSASVSGLLERRAIDYVNAACRRMRPGDRAGVIVFGREAYIEVPPRPAARERPILLHRIVSNPSPNFTNISAALRLAMAAFPPNMIRRVVLITDGNENVGSAVEEALFARATGVRIDTVALGAGTAHDAWLDGMLLPREVRAGQPFELKLMVGSENRTAGVVRLLEDGRLKQTRRVSLEPGTATFSFPLTEEDAGFHRYLALLDAAPDDLTENNRAEGFVFVAGQPKVLCVDGQPASAGYLARALAAQGIPVDVRGPASLPHDLADLQRYDAVLLSDVPATQVAPGQMAMLRAAVHDLGIGFGMLGGENSFGAGGYYRTPVEDALPVTMGVRKRRSFPILSVCIVVDKSGSMGMAEEGTQKIRLASEAAIMVTEVLQPTDRIGVIVYDERPKTVVPLTPAKDRRGIQGTLASLVAGGGTSVYPAVAAAQQMLEAAQTPGKHIILIADGSHCPGQTGCASLVTQMAKSGTTFSAVAVGNGGDVQFLRGLARAGRGRFYLARRASDLPYVLTRDAMLMSKTLLVEGPFQPRARADEVTEGIDWSAAPPLLGYVATTPRPLAAVPLLSGKGDPILARWQYGIGRSVAFTSDVKARWSARWVGWRGFGPLFARTVRWIMRPPGSHGMDLEVSAGQGVARVRLSVADEHGEPVNLLRPVARIVCPDLSALEVRLEQTGLGRYEASFPARQIGAYLVQARAALAGGRAGLAYSGLSIPYSPEYRATRPNTALLARLAEETGGAVDPKPTEVFGGRRPITHLRNDLWPVLVLVCALLLPLDVALRRLTAGAAGARAAVAWLAYRAKVGRARRMLPAAVPVLTPLELLLAAKARRREQPATTPIELAGEAADTLHQPREQPTPSSPTTLEEVPLATRLLAVRRRAARKPQG